MVDILQAFEKASAQGLRTALATVVHVDGSSYRRPGARMLIDENGWLTGAISGGCLEGDALRKALQVILQQQPRLVTYDTADEADAGVGMQLGCEGIIQVLIEPLPHASDKGPMHLLQLACKGRNKKVLATVFSLAQKQTAQQGTSLLLQEDGTLIGQLHTEKLQEDISAEMQRSLQLGQHKFLHYQFGDEQTQVFLEYVPAPIRLVVGGAGNDVIPLVNTAQLLGWQTTVLDGRPAYAKAERFAAGCMVVLSKQDELLQQILPDSRTAFVMMSHNYNYDKSMLQALLSHTEVAYMGMLGPKKKLQQMLDDIQLDGVEVPEHFLQKIYGPAGLEIGAETPEEIAISIIAEIQAVITETPGGMLRQKQAVIHNRAETHIHTKTLDV